MYGSLGDRNRQVLLQFSVEPLFNYSSLINMYITLIAKASR